MDAAGAEAGLEEIEVFAGDFSWGGGVAGVDGPGLGVFLEVGSGTGEGALGEVEIGFDEGFGREVGV